MREICVLPYVIIVQTFTESVCLGQNNTFYSRVLFLKKYLFRVVLVSNTVKHNNHVLQMQVIAIRF